MLKIVVHVNRPSGLAQGIKEQIAMDLERFGDARVISVEELVPERPRQIQTHMDGFGDMPPPKNRNRR